MTMISLLHLDPRPGEMEFNSKLIEAGILQSAKLGARWIITPELALSGYYFREIIGTDWIQPQPDKLLNQMRRLARIKGLNLFITCPTRDKNVNKLYNSVFVINSNGDLVGEHRKIKVHPGTEISWASPGSLPEPIIVDRIKIGLLICVDIYEDGLMMNLKEKGAKLVICPSAWGPKYLPGDLWERRTAETGLPLWVCNRTGREKDVDWSEGESVVAIGGKRVIAIQSTASVAILFDWNFQTMTLNRSSVKTIII